MIDGVPVWNAEVERVKAIILTLARGHPAYELNEPKTGKPRYIQFIPLPTMTDSEREDFESSGSAVVATWPDFGRRALQRLIVAGADVYAEGWVVVQEGNYQASVPHNLPRLG